MPKPKNSEDKIVRRKAGEIPKTSPEDMARMLAIRDEDIDTSDIPERTGARRRLRRVQDVRLARPRSVIRESIVAAMAEREMTAYSLCKAAKLYCPTISETAVGEFLKGERSIGLMYVEALLVAADLIVARNPRRPPLKDLREAIREVDRDDGFWVHLVSQEGRACSWKRYKELPGGRWSDEVIDEGVSNLYDPNDFRFAQFPWVVRLSRHGNTGDFMIGGGGANDFWAQVISHLDQAFSWQFIEPSQAGQWTVIGDGGLLNAYEANGRLPERFPWVVDLHPRDIEGEFMFSV